MRWDEGSGAAAVAERGGLCLSRHAVARGTRGCHGGLWLRCGAHSSSPIPRISGEPFRAPIWQSHYLPAPHAFSGCGELGIRGVECEFMVTLGADLEPRGEGAPPYSEEEVATAAAQRTAGASRPWRRRLEPTEDAAAPGDARG